MNLTTACNSVFLILFYLLYFEATIACQEGVVYQSTDNLLKYSFSNTTKKYNFDLKILQKPGSNTFSKILLENKITKYIYYIKYNNSSNLARNIAFFKLFDYKKYMNIKVLSGTNFIPTTPINEIHSKVGAATELSNAFYKPESDNNITTKHEVYSNATRNLKHEKNILFWTYNYYFYYFDIVGRANYMIQFSEHKLRLSSIKYNILTKLGLVLKPNVTSKIPRKFIINTLKRTDIKENHFFASNKYTWNFRSSPDNIYETNMSRKRFTFTFSDQSARKDKDDDVPNNEKVIVFAEKERVRSRQTIVEFKTSFKQTVRDKMGKRSKNPIGRLRSAFLWLPIGYQRQDLKQNDSDTFRNVNTTLWIFRLLYSEKNGKYRASLCAIEQISAQNMKWKSFDITSTFRLWSAIDSSSQKLRFLIECSGFCENENYKRFNKLKTKYDLAVQRSESSQKKTKTSTLTEKVSGSYGYTKTKVFYKSIVRSASESSAAVDLLVSLSVFPLRISTRPNRSQTPFLIIYIRSNNISRSRRRVNYCSKNVQGDCCKEKLYVNFRELGWNDWIIAPHGYYANYCKGDCKKNQIIGLAQSNHGHVVSEYRKHGRNNDKILACCTPVRFSSMSIIYYEENRKIVKRDLPKMTVDSCGCPY